MNQHHHSLCPQAIKIEWANGKKLRSRKVVIRSNTKGTCKHPSWKMGRMMQAESENEEHAFMWLDANPDVCSYNEQPCVIFYELNGEKHHHFPDIFVKTKYGQELWEVKPINDANQPEIACRTAYLTKCLMGLGYSYRVVHAESLVVEPQLTNIKRLIRLGKAPVDLKCKERIRLLFRESQFIPWKLLNQKGIASQFDLARLLLEGYLECDMSQLINDETLISMITQTGGQS